jgi:UDP-2,3-diacylglucosamine pyrophosphatase LpxH
MHDPDRTQKIRLRSVFVSDVHLGSRDCRAAELLSFLESIEADYLFLVGDIVDFWSLRRSFY